MDGANCPNTSSNNPASHSLLLKNGLIRIPIQLPAVSQFTIRAVVDPYGCAIVTDSGTGLQTVSVYRRPLPTTNLRFLSAIMFDGRETIAPLNNPQTFQANLVADLMHQSVSATVTHAEGAVPTIAQQTDIVNFELGLSSAQLADYHAGLLNQHGAMGGAHRSLGARLLPGYQRHPGRGSDRRGVQSHAIYAVFVVGKSEILETGETRRQVAARQDIAAGEKLFNSHPLTVTGVRGLNDNPALAAALDVSAAHCVVPRNLHHLSRRAQCRRPLAALAARYRNRS